ncbi:MAG: hypothetical protein ACKOXI_03360 [Candidatus Planktophila sp.]
MVVVFDRDKVTNLCSELCLGKSCITCD